jgi:hypothetical protein
MMRDCCLRQHASRERTYIHTYTHTHTHIQHKPLIDADDARLLSEAARVNGTFTCSGREEDKFAGEELVRVRNDTRSAVE